MTDPWDEREISLHENHKNQPNLGKYTSPIMDCVVVTQIFFIFTPKIVEMIQFDEHIFQLGGSSTN